MWYNFFNNLSIVIKVQNSNSSTFTDIAKLIVYIYVDGQFKFKSQILSLQADKNDSLIITPRLSGAAGAKREKSLFGRQASSGRVSMGHQSGTIE